MFELARGEGRLEQVGASLTRLRAALDDSPEFRQLVVSPLVSREQATAGALRVAETLALDPITRNFLGVLGRNRRLGSLRDIISGFFKLVAADRGETTAEVTSAHPLDGDQEEALRGKLRAGLGRDVAIDLKIDPSILGGLVVRIGSRMVDSSLKTKLALLGQKMKG